MLYNWKSKFYLFIARLDFQCLLPLNRSMFYPCSILILGFFKIIPVNGLAFVYSFYDTGFVLQLSNYQFAES